MSFSTRATTDTASAYQSWYTAEALETLAYAGSPSNLPVYRYVFLPQDNTTTFAVQLRNLQTVRNTLKASHAIFIAMEPGDFETSHYIFGVLINRNLIIINPMGESRHTGFYKYLSIAQKDLHFDAIYISNTPIQRDKKTITACGPICVELMAHLSNLPALAIASTLQSLTATATRKQLDDGSFYNVVDIADTVLMPRVFQNSSDINYSTIVSMLRKQHDKILAQDTASLPDETYDERTLMNTIIMDNLDLVSALDEESFQRLEKKFKKMQQPTTLSSTAASLQSLPEISKQKSPAVSATSPITTKASPSSYTSNASSTHFKPSADNLSVPLLNNDALPSDDTEKSASCCCVMQ